MKKIFFVILVLWSAVSYSQAPNYNNYNVRNHFWQFSTNGLNIPAGATPVKLTGQYARSGALFYDTTGVDTGLYVSHGAYWVKVGVGSFNTSLGTGYKFAVDGTNNVKSIFPYNGLTGDSATGGQVGVRLGGAFNQHTRIYGSNIYKMVFDDMADNTGDTAFAVLALGNGMTFTPTPTNRNFTNPVSNQYVFKVDARNLTEGIGGFFGDDFGVSSLDIYNFYDSAAHGSGSPTYAAAAAAVFVGFKNTNHNLVMQLYTGPVRNNSGADSAHGIFFNGRGLNIAGYGGNNPYIRFGGGLTSSSYGYFERGGKFGLNTETPTEQLTVNGQVRITTISNVGTPDSALYIEDGVVKAGLAGGGSGSGTVNTGASNKATYYPSAGTTVDDFIGVEYGLTNNTMRLLPQAVGDTALVILAKASQTAPLLVAQNSAGLAQFKIWENGYIGNSIYKLYPVEFHTNVGGVYARFGTNFAFATAPENSQVGYGAFGRTDGSEVGLYKYDATGGIGFYVNGITTPKVYLAASNSNLGIGTGTTVSARLHSLSTTEQLRLGYDASNYLSTTIGSTGGTTFDAIGAGSIFNFSDNVTITNNSLNGNQLYVSSTSTAVNGPASLVRADFSGANASASVSTYGGFFNNSRTGTTSLTYGVYGQASDGTTNYGVFGQASGGTTAIGGNFTVSGASNNYPIITAGGNSGFNTANPTSVLHTTSFATAYRAITALRTLDITDHTIEVTANTFTVTLPTAVGITGRQYIITNSGAGTTTIATTSSQTFVNVTATPTTLTVNQYGVVTVVSNGANWLRTSSLGFGLFVLIVLLPTLVFRRRNFLDDCYKQAA